MSSSEAEGRSGTESLAGRSPAITVLVCTYNRADDLRELLESVVGQPLEGADLEILVVDNNSPDHTRAVVEAQRARPGVDLRYLFEGRQGKSHALNAGLAAARGEICAIIDDDQLMPPDYVRTLVDAFLTHPDVAFVGGKVLPVWEEEPPAWLTREHWSPLGMSDYGDEPFFVDEAHPVCLLTCAFRLADLRAVGGFREELGVTGNSGIGSTEDAEIQERLWSSGRQGYYEPRLVLRHKAPARRLSKKYFRRWHRGHGRFSALRRESTVETSSVRIFDVPGHIYRQALTDMGRWIWAKIRVRSEAAFEAECSLCFFRGFAEQRVGRSAED